MNAEINVWNPQVQEQNGFSLAAVDNNGVTPDTIEASTRHGKMGMLGRVGLIGLRVTGHFKRVIMGSGQSSCGSGRVDPYFSHEFVLYIYIMKTTCICHLESYATNYLM